VVVITSWGQADSASAVAARAATPRADLNIMYLLTVLMWMMMMMMMMMMMELSLNEALEVVYI
jgi:hypothetical protein